MFTFCDYNLTTICINYLYKLSRSLTTRNALKVFLFKNKIIFILMITISHTRRSSKPDGKSLNVLDIIFATIIIDNFKTKLIIKIISMKV